MTTPAIVQTANWLRSEAIELIEDNAHRAVGGRDLSERLDEALENVWEAKRLANTADVLEFGTPNN